MILFVFSVLLLATLSLNYWLDHFVTKGTSLNSSGKVLKKILIVFASLGLVLLTVMILVPFMIHVDDYRPKITSLANENINGKLELGKLTLTLWGKLMLG